MESIPAYHGTQIDIFGNEHEITIEAAHIVQGDLFQWKQDRDSLQAWYNGNMITKGGREYAPHRNKNE